MSFFLWIMIHIHNMEGMIVNRLSNLEQTLLLVEMKLNLVTKALLVQVKINKLKQILFKWKQFNYKLSC